MTKKHSAEVIVVGAGISGLTTAKLLADANIDVTVIERNSKGVTKGNISSVFYKNPLAKTFTNFPQGFERNLSECRTYVLQGNSSLSVSLKGKKEDGFILEMSELLGFVSNEVKKSGVEINYETVAEKLIISDNKIIGVKTNNEDIFSNVVVIAEGVNSILTKNSGLRKGELTSDQTYLFVNEDIELPSSVIEERFNLNKDEGIAIKFFTEFDIEKSINGIGYLYTNKNSVSLGIGVLFSELILKAVNINNCQEKLKSHQLVKNFINGGITKNYSSFMLPSHKSTPLPKISADGCLIVGGAALMVNPFSWDISTMAIISSEIAAETIKKAKEINDYSLNTLSSYKEQLINNEAFQAFKEEKIPDEISGLFIQGDNLKSFNQDIVSSLGSYVLKGK